MRRQARGRLLHALNVASGYRIAAGVLGDQHPSSPHLKRWARIWLHGAQRLNRRSRAVGWLP